MCDGFNLPFVDNPTYIIAPSPLPFSLFSETPLLTTFWKYCPNEIRDKRKNKLVRGIYLLMLRRLQNKISCYFCRKNFYKQHQAEIWYEIITISGTKGLKRKINIINERFNKCLKQCPTPFYKHLLYGLPPPLKSVSLYDKRIITVLNSIEKYETRLQYFPMILLVCHFFTLFVHMLYCVCFRDCKMLRKSASMIHDIWLEHFHVNKNSQYSQWIVLQLIYSELCDKNI